MTSSLFPGRLLVLLVTLSLSSPLVARARSQGAPTPFVAFAVNKIPALASQVIPVDVTGDGRIDLVANGSLTTQPALVLATGRGDGTFTTPVELGIAASPLATGDFNGDGRADLVVRRLADIAVLPGNGNGTFAAARSVLAAPVTEVPESPGFAVPGNFQTEDRHLGLALPGTTPAGDPALLLFAGNGNFSFDAPVIVPLVEPLTAARATNFNADGLTDIVGVGGSIHMLRSIGSLSYDVRDLQMAVDIGDVLGTDLDGDGVTDVVASLYFPDSQAPGAVVVLMNGFSGTELQEYEAGVKGEFSLAAGDFDGDGRTDIATGNWSTYRDDDWGRQMWSSVSVLKGTGEAAALDTPVTFALGDVNFEGYTSSWRLETADLNSDGRLDLVHSPGAVLINRQPVPNRAPIAFAGPDRSLPYESIILLSGRGSDPDGHWLTYRWSGSPREAPQISLGGQLGAEPGVYQFTLTVADGHAGTDTDSVTVRVNGPGEGSAALSTPTIFEDTVSTSSPYTIRWQATDDIRLFHVSYSTDEGRTFIPMSGCINLPRAARSCVWQNPGPAGARAILRLEAIYDSVGSYIDISEPFTLVARSSSPLPDTWQSRDVGPVGAAGSASFAGGAFMVHGAGADIWGATDAFHFVAGGGGSGDFDLVARVASVENVNAWTKAGLMIRMVTNGFEQNAAHVSLFATPSAVKGIAYQARLASGASSIERARAAGAPPVWLKLMRRGNTVQGAYRFAASAPWILLPPIPLPPSAEVSAGLAVSSHVSGRLATATFDNVTVTRAVPQPWTHADIGAVGVAGLSSFDGSTFTVAGSGADIWDRADELQFTYQELTGNFDVSARVASVQNVNAWTKAGLMIRGSLAAGSPHVSLFATPGTTKGIAFQRRTTMGGLSTHTSGPAKAPPVWLRLSRVGDQVFAYWRAGATDSWIAVGSQNVPTLPGTVYVGLAVSSHVDGTLATATFDHVTVENTMWTFTDIGPVGRFGFWSVADDGWRVDASGADIWGTADAFGYLHRPWTGDGQITVRVDSLTNTNPWAKAGVMFRDSLDPGSPQVMAIVSPARGVAMQYRAGSNLASANAAIESGAAPTWLRLVRAGDTFTTYRSDNGVSWQVVQTITVPMSHTAYIGLAVTSHVRGTLTTAVFDDVSVEP